MALNPNIQPRWEIGKVPKEQTPCLNGNVSLVLGSETPESEPTILVDFKIVMFSASGPLSRANDDGFVPWTQHVYGRIQQYLSRRQHSPPTTRH